MTHSYKHNIQPYKQEFSVLESGVSNRDLSAKIKMVFSESSKPTSQETNKSVGSVIWRSFPVPPTCNHINISILSKKKEEKNGPELQTVLGFFSHAKSPLQT